jgi:holo-[acyl-carrier protein] synthase
MIIGIGLDVVDVARFTERLAATPRLAERLFVDGERGLPQRSLAARFAAKEALAKALGAPGSLRWHDAAVVTEVSGKPRFEVSGTVAARCEALGVAHLHLSLTHDAGVAAAVVVAEA